jgi:hypothetical protein
VEVATIASGGRPCRHRGIMQSIFCTNIVSTGAESAKNSTESMEIRGVSLRIN